MKQVIWCAWAMVALVFLSLSGFASISRYSRVDDLGFACEETKGIWELGAREFCVGTISGENLSTAYGREQMRQMLLRLKPLIDRLIEDECFRKMAAEKLGAEFSAWLEKLKTADGAGDLLTSLGRELLINAGTMGMAKIKWLDELEEMAKLLNRLAPKLRVAAKGAQTGAGGFLGSADEAYAAIRASISDVGEIATSPGFKPANIQKGKDHLFVNEQLLYRYVGQGIPATVARFDSDIGITQAWSRLLTGTYTPADIQLLRHETAEAWFMRRHGPGYNAVHNAAQGRYPTPQN